jgi:hypothetical protein
MLARRTMPTIERRVLPPIDTLFELLWVRLGMPRLRHDRRQR